MAKLKNAGCSVIGAMCLALALFTFFAVHNFGYGLLFVVLYFGAMEVKKLC